MHLYALTALILALFGASLPARAADDVSMELMIREHKFEPSVLEVPANQRIKLVVTNSDPTPEEFESYELNREKVISGRGKATIYIGPLKPGAYPFFGEFHQDTAQGQIVAK